MPTIVTGQGSVVSATKPWTKMKISAVSNTTPIQITTQLSHGFFQTDTVAIEGTGIGAIDGQVFQANIINPNTFTLLGTSAPGTTSASGYAIDYQLQPAISLPAGGELADPNVAGAAWEGCINPVPFLYQRCGMYSFFQGYYVASGTLSNPLKTSWKNLSTFTPYNTWHDMLGSGGFTLGQMAIGAVAPYVKSNDAFSAEATFTIQLTSTTFTEFLPIAFGLFLSQGGTPDFAPAASPFATAMTVLQYPQGSGGGSTFVVQQPITLRGFIPNLLINGGGGLTLPASNFGLTIGYQADVGIILSGAATVSLVGPLTMSAVQYRSN